MLYNKKNHVWSRVKNIAFFKNKPIVFQNTHCFPTCALFHPIVLKRKIITVHSVYFIYLLITNVLLRFGATSLLPVTLHGASNLLEYRILLTCGTTARLQELLGSICAKYWVLSRAPGQRRLILSPKCTKPSLDMLKSTWKISFMKEL